MLIPTYPFHTLNWSQIEKVIHPGKSGIALWQTFMMGEIRIRMVQYSPGYSADHWCDKGHIIYCIEGKMTTVLEDGRTFILKKGMTYHVGDQSDTHQSSTATGCQLFIVD